MTQQKPIFMVDHIIKKPVSELIWYEFNNKKHPEKQIDMLANSIASFWFLVPILIDENNIIVWWHWRLLAAKKLWMDIVPCIDAKHLTKAQVKKYRILDNRLSDPDLSPYDEANLQQELVEMADPEMFDLFPDIVSPDDMSDNISLPSWEKGEMKTMSFTLHNEQAKEVERAMEIAKNMWDFWDTWNENKNWNAIARVCEIFITQNQ